jgi:SpoVK/Ycf46/Vps4 family AAA+-type ATPase
MGAMPLSLMNLILWPQAGCESRDVTEMNRAVNALIRQTDNCKGRSLIAAANFEQPLDFAVWRRFDSTLKFSPPNQEEQIRLFNLRLKEFAGPKNQAKIFLTILPRRIIMIVYFFIEYAL